MSIHQSLMLYVFMQKGHISERPSYEHVAVSRYNRDNSPDDIYAKYIIAQNLKAFKEQATVASVQVN